MSLLDDKAAYARRLPPVDASIKPTWDTVPNDAVAVGNSMADVFDVVLPVVVKVAT